MPDFDISPERRLRLARDLFSKTGGRGWEPPDPNHPLVKGLVEAGYVRRTDGICGFERIKDACVTWTESARAMLAAPAADPFPAA